MFARIATPEEISGIFCFRGYRVFRYFQLLKHRLWLTIRTGLRRWKWLQFQTLVSMMRRNVLLKWITVWPTEFCASARRLLFFTTRFSAIKLECEMKIGRM